MSGIPLSTGTFAKALAQAAADKEAGKSIPLVVGSEIDVFDFAPKYYVANPETEKIVFDGMELQNGMEVLIEDPACRAKITPGLKDDEDEFDLALVMNRWCTVSDFRVIDETSIGFIATYPDETQRKRVVDFDEAWIVKKRSVHDALETLKAGVARRIRLAAVGDNPDVSQRYIPLEIVGSITEEIFEYLVYSLKIEE